MRTYIYPYNIHSHYYTTVNAWNSVAEMPSCIKTTSEGHRRQTLIRKRTRKRLGRPRRCAMTRRRRRWTGILAVPTVIENSHFPVVRPRIVLYYAVTVVVKGNNNINVCTRRAFIFNETITTVKREQKFD